jgi:hypothetical protein
MRKQKLDKNHIITKQYNLNLLRPNGMSLQGLRLFAIYLSKINPLDESTRKVSFLLEDFAAIMEFKSRANIAYFKEAAEKILCNAVSIPRQDGGFTAFQIFKECEVLQSEEDGQWYFTIDAHDRALPYMFDLQGRFFKYKLWNTLRLKSRNQLRMYELLKQREREGSAVFSVDYLRQHLGIEQREYPRFTTFKHGVLEACKEALEEYTDITFTYESYGRKGQRGKINSLKFTIQVNQKYKDPLLLEEFIDLRKQELQIDMWDLEGEQREEAMGESYRSSETSHREKMLIFLSDAVDQEFSKVEMEILLNTLNERLPGSADLQKFDHLKNKYSIINYKHSNGQIRERFGYLKKIIGTD